MKQVQDVEKTQYEFIKQKIILELSGMSEHVGKCNDMLYFHFGSFTTWIDIADYLLGCNMLEDKDIRSMLDPLCVQIELLRGVSV